MDKEKLYREANREFRARFEDAIALGPMEMSPYQGIFRGWIVLADWMKEIDHIQKFDKHSSDFLCVHIEGITAQ